MSAMTPERKIEAIRYAIKWVDSSEAFDSSEDQPQEDALALLEAMLLEAHMAKSVNDLTASWAELRPDLPRDVLRKEAAKEVRKAYKDAAA